MESTIDYCNIIRTTIKTIEKNIKKNIKSIKEKKLLTDIDDWKKTVASGLGNFYNTQIMFKRERIFDTQKIYTDILECVSNLELIMGQGNKILTRIGRLIYT